MNDEAADAGKLILRLALGLLVLQHGIGKIVGGLGGIEGMLAGYGLPQFLAYGVYVGEIVAPLMIIAGVYTRIGAGLIVANMLFAFGLAHMNELFTLNDRGLWPLELQGMFLFSAAALALIGSGRLAARPD